MCGVNYKILGGRGVVHTLWTSTPLDTYQAVTTISYISLTVGEYRGYSLVASILIVIKYS